MGDALPINSDKKRHLKEIVTFHEINVDKLVCSVIVVSTKAVTNVTKYSKLLNVKKSSNDEKYQDWRMGQA